MIGFILQSVQRGEIVTMTMINVTFFFSKEKMLRFSFGSVCSEGMQEKSYCATVILLWQNSRSVGLKGRVNELIEAGYLWKKN